MIDEPLPELEPDKSYEIWHSSLAVLFAVVAFFMVAMGVQLIVMFLFGGQILGIPSDELPFRLNEDPSLAENGALVWRMALFSSLAGMLFIFVLIMLKKAPIADYLNINVPPLKDWLIWIGVFFGFSFLFESTLADLEVFQVPFMDNVTSTIDNQFMFLLGVGVFAPLFEEFLFRGFLFKSLLRSMNPHLVVWLTSIAFGLLHVPQYNLALGGLVMALGVILGYSRYYSGSLTIPIVLHIFNNVVSTFIESS